MIAGLHATPGKCDLARPVPPRLVETTLLRTAA